MAAQVNASMAHALDYDNAHDGAIMHPGVITVITSLSVAERIGGLSGKDFILSIVLGDDFLCRLGLAVAARVNPVKMGWHQTTLFGYLCAAAVTGKIIGLDKDRMVNALGIAYHQCSGNGQCTIDGALTKRMGPGFAVNGGITSALMAERGITGAKDSLEGEWGLFNQYHRGNYDVQVLTSELGKRYEGINISIKPYPCCRGAHTSIDAALTLVNENKIIISDIDKIIVFTGEGNFQLLCSPIEIKRNPRNTIDSQFSIPWVVATAIVNGKIAISDFTPESFKNKSILEISNKIDVQIDPKLNRSGQLEPVRVVVNLKSGEILTKQCDNALGSLEKPVSFGDCIEKFRDCCAYATNPIPEYAIDRTLRIIEKLDEITDVTEIIRTIS
jgi:2-methylcitrate dehydratase PrpD